MQTITNSPAFQTTTSNLPFVSKTTRDRFKKDYKQFMEYAKVEMRAFTMSSGKKVIEFYKDTASKGVMNFVKEHSKFGITELALVALAVGVAGMVAYFFTEYCYKDEQVASDQKDLTSGEIIDLAKRA
ncbi:MAG: hypothetical protein SP4CHLAM5_08810 [Chlamydiia bacterium]|nr:hypothetical protein [Chlamydiia bacterium]MCH9618744.1 hypothetical protein [Chlamydiia bacterium]MCH9624516.1 hypothetical protein [Chlamydiia bacterium]